MEPLPPSPSPVAPLPRTVRLLGWVSFAADVSSEMVYPLLPLFLTAVLHAPALSLGLVEGAAQAIVSFVAAFGGASSDRSGRRTPLIRWGYGIPILGKAVITCAASWHGVLAGRLIDRFGKGLRGAPRDALIADATDSALRGRAFGFHRMMDTAGAFTGVIIAALLFSGVTGGTEESRYRLAFGAATAFACGSLIVALLVKESATVAPPGAKRSPLAFPVGLSRRFWLTVLMLNIFALANSSDTFLLLRAADRGFSPLHVILAYAVYNFGYAALSYPLGSLSDRVGRWKLIIAGWLLYGAVYAGFAWASAGALWLLFAAYGLYMAMTDGITKALIVDEAPSDARGAALGLLQLTLGLTGILSNIAAGLLWDQLGHEWPFLFGGVAAVGAAGIALRLSLSATRE